MELEDLIPSYPNIDNFTDDLLNPYPDFYQSLYQKNEFYQDKLEKIETPVNNDYLKHQKIISRFLSSYTPYDAVLADHDMGTGKSFVATAIAELIKREKTTIKKVLYLTRGQGLIANFINQLVFGKPLKGDYLPENYLELTERELVIRKHKKVADFYSWNTFQTFGDNVSKRSDKDLAEEFSNHLIIIDEVHNLRTQDQDEKTYEHIHRFLHVLKNCKVLLLSGTPMKDQPNEIATVMNLILPLDKQLPTGKNFNKEFLTEIDGIFYINKSSEPKLKEYFRGRVSYLRGMASEAKITFEGEKILKHFKIYEDVMSDFQQEGYLTALNKETKDKGLYSDARQASLFVFPDKSYGGDGYRRYLTDKDGKITLKMPEIRDLEDLKKYSMKYYNTISLLLSEKSNAFVYCDFVEGSGAVLFTKLLEKFGVGKFSGLTSNLPEKKALRYSVITNKTTTDKEGENIISVFNSKENLHGDYLRIIIGSRVAGEGFSLKNIQQIHILTPFWNYSETAQAIMRGIRLFSFQDLIDEGITPNVKIYLHASIPTDDNIMSIDKYMYATSEKKDISMKNMDRILKESSFDCQLTYLRNYLPEFRDGSRECDYQKCEYQCDGITDIAPEIDYSTYNLYYPPDLSNEILEILKSQKSFLYLQGIPELISIENLTKSGKSDNGRYTREDSNVIYLTDDYHSKDASDVYYISNFVKQKSDIFSELVKDRIPVIIANLCNSNNREELISILPDDIIEIIIEQSILAQHNGISSDFRDWVLKRYKYSLKSYLNITVSTLLGARLYRCFENGKWRDSSEEEETQIVIKGVELKKQAEKNQFGYYGMLKNGKFAIRDTSKDINLDGGERNDKRKITTGKDCNSWNVYDLAMIAARIGAPIPSPQKNPEELRDLISKKRDLEEHLVEINKLTQQEYLTFGNYYFLRGKNTTCERIKKRFEEIGLMI